MKQFFFLLCLLAFSVVAQAQCDKPTNLTTSGVTATGFTASWTPSANNDPVIFFHKTAIGGIWKYIITSSGSVTVGGLTPATAYVWRARSKCGTNFSTQSAAQNLTTLAAMAAPESGDVEYFDMMGQRVKFEDMVPGVLYYGRAGGVTKLYLKK